MKKEKIEILFRQHYGPMMRLAKRMLYDDEESRDVVRAKFEQAYTLEMKQNMVTDDDTISYTSVEQWYQQMMAYAKKHLIGQTLMVFRMRHIDGMKYQEIADQLGISRVMVYKHLTKAMNTIREYNNQKKYLEPLDKGRL